MASTYQGYLLVADITGYTSYLSRSELEHAQEVLGALLEILIENTKAPLQISRLEGDAVFSYTLPGIELGGQSFVELVENTYVAFRRAIELMVLNNTCRCNACANISSLDLKFFVHHGTFGLQKLGEHQELVGSDVNLIHRLLKNTVVETTGLRAYVLYTEAAVQHLGLGGFAETLIHHNEAYEHLGEVGVFVQDLHPVWQARREAEVIKLPAADVILSVDGVIDMAPELVWDYLAKPEFRSILMGSDRQEIIDRKDGRIGPDSAFQCFHGNRVVTQTILEWRPFERILTRDMPLPKVFMLDEFCLEPVGESTRLIQRIGRPSGPALKVALVRVVLRLEARKGQQEIADFAEAIQKDLASLSSV